MAGYSSLEQPRLYYPGVSRGPMCALDAPSNRGRKSRYAMSANTHLPEGADELDAVRPIPSALTPELREPEAVDFLHDTVCCLAVTVLGWSLLIEEMLESVHSLVASIEVESSHAV